MIIYEVHGIIYSTDSIGDEKIECRWSEAFYADELRAQETCDILNNCRATRQHDYYVRPVEVIV